MYGQNAGLSDGTPRQSSTPARFNPRSGMSYGEWLTDRDKQAMDRLKTDLNQGYHKAGEAIAQMAGVAYDPDYPDAKVEEAMAILRQRNPLGGPWISLIQDYHRMRQAEQSLVG